MEKQRNGFFHLMCQERQADEVLHLAYSESRLSALLEHASVDVLCYDSFKKRTYAFECKYVSATRSLNVTFELSHQNGKVGWALDECTMNNYIVFFLQGVGAVLCDMKVFQSAVKDNLDTFNVREYNDSNIAQVHYDWLINEAGGVYYTEEQLLYADAMFNEMQSRRLLELTKEVGANAIKYNIQGLIQMECARQMQAK